MKTFRATLGATLATLVVGCSPAAPSAAGDGATSPTAAGQPQATPTQPAPSAISQATLAAGNQLTYEKKTIVADKTTTEHYQYTIDKVTPGFKSGSTVGTNYEFTAVKAGATPDFSTGKKDSLSKFLADADVTTPFAWPGSPASTTGKDVEVADEAVTVRAGTFQARRFKVKAGTTTSTTWLSGRVLVKLDVAIAGSGFAGGTQVELISLK